jgi:hydrogenase nickel incorporation protein HypA/HybF
MHELSVASSILDTALEKGRELSRIDEIHLSLGCLMMLNPDQLRFGFEMLARGTIAEKAVLRFEIRKARVRCSRGHETEVDVKEFSVEHLLPAARCSLCGEPTEVLEGRELILTRIIGE